MSTFTERVFTPRVGDAFRFASPFGQNITPQVRAQAAAQAVADVQAAAQARLAAYLRQPRGAKAPDKADKSADAQWRSNLAVQPQGAATGGMVGAATGQIGQIATAENIWSALSLAGTIGGAYHGYRQSRSVGWAIVWALLGGLFPVITIPVAVAQGFGKRAER